MCIAVSSQQDRDRADRREPRRLRSPDESMATTECPPETTPAAIASAVADLAHRFIPPPGESRLNLPLS